MNLREYLKETNLITDGAFGTYFAAKYQTQEIPELANLSDPELSLIHNLDVYKRQEHILAVSEFAAKADAYFEAEAERVLRESERKEKSRTGNSVKIRTEILDPQPEILKTYIIRRMILNDAGKAIDITERHIRLVMDLSRCV